MPPTNNPFQQLRQNLPGQIFGAAGAFGQQFEQSLAGTGRFDPNIAQSIRNRLFGQASTALSTGFADLTARQGLFQENQRQFDLGFAENQRQFDITSELQRAIFEAEKKAGKTNIWDVVTGIGGLLPGIGSIFTGLSAAKKTGLLSDLANLFSGGDDGETASPSLQIPFLG